MLFKENIVQKVSIQIFLFKFNKSVNTIKSNSSVITYNSSSAITIWKTSKQTITSCSSDCWCISIKNTVIMCFSVCCEVLVNFIIKFKAMSFKSLHSNLCSTIHINNSFKRFVSLQTNNNFIVLIDVTWCKCINTTQNICFNI